MHFKCIYLYIGPFINYCFYFLLFQIKSSITGSSTVFLQTYIQNNKTQVSGFFCFFCLFVFELVAEINLLLFILLKLAIVFNVEQLLRYLQQVLETHEVNWKHVLCFVSTLLVYNQSAQSSLRGKHKETLITSK